MNETTIYIPSLQLIDYVEKNEVAWQICDSLIEFSSAKGYEFTDEHKQGYEVKNNDMLSVLANAKECQVFNPETDDCAGFEDLTEWSECKGLLILVDNELLLCIAPCDKYEVLAMTA